MSHAFVTLIAASMVLCASAGVTQSARDVRGPSPLIAIENQAPPKLIVDPPLPEPLSQGIVFIQYRTENLRIAPVFGKGALAVSPRAGHAHVTVDDAGWHFVDASGETLIVVGLKPGSHKVLIELAGSDGPYDQRNGEVHLTPAPNLGSEVTRAQQRMSV